MATDARSDQTVRSPAGDTALSSWRDGPAKRAILQFVATTCGDGRSDPVPPEDRVAVFDNDGTLWCEKPMPIQLDFVLRRLVEMAADDPSLRGRQPWKAAAEHDGVWLGTAMTEYYAGDDTKVRQLLAGVVAAHEGLSVEEFEASSGAFLRAAQHPTLGRRYLACAYAPMIELLDHLGANGFTCYIVSGGGRDFMRPISQEVYGIPRERVIGSALTLTYVGDEAGGTIRRTATPEFLDDGPEKPVRIWTRTGRRPLMAAGNSNGDVEMLDFTRHGDKPFLRLLVLHDDADREFDYVSGAERALQRAGTEGWTVMSMKHDWATVF